MGRVPERFLRAFAGGVVIEVDCLPALPRYPLHPQTAAIPEQIARSTASRRSPISTKTGGRVRRRGRIARAG
jgi:hypothetical protein